MSTPTTKLSQVKAAIESGKEREAVRICARFPQLGEHREAILDAQMAFTNPSFCRGLKKDPEALIRAGVEAIKARYSL